MCPCELPDFSYVPYWKFFLNFFCLLLFLGLIILKFFLRIFTFFILKKRTGTLRGGVEPPRGKCLTGFPGLRLTGLDYLSKKVS